MVAGELGAVADPSTRVQQAIERLDRCIERLSGTDDAPWPGSLNAFCLPGGNGAALTTEACAAYGEALSRMRGGMPSACGPTARTRLLDELLRAFGAGYERRKRQESALDFEDLELLTRELLRSNAELRERYRTRFERIMVDELQDTNAVQLELIELLGPRQPVHRRRRAAVDLRLPPRRRRAVRAARRPAASRSGRGPRCRPTSARAPRSSRSLNRGVRRSSSATISGRLRRGARTARRPSDEPRVELLVADKGADWAIEGVASPWRIAEARILAARVGELLADGASAREIVVLTRATTDLRAYERALEERGIPTYVIGGRGYWSHPQVVDVVAYLRALANPRDEEALYTVLASPMVAASVDALVTVAAAARASGRDPWWVLREPDGRLDELAPEDAAELAQFARWFAGEREAVARCGIEELIDRVLALTGYDLAVLAMPGGQRRLANVRKLMRLAREHEAAARAASCAASSSRSPRGPASGAAPGLHESEAPVEGEALDAVRLMTIHRAKGLEFEIVCVADLGRGPRWRADADAGRARRPLWTAARQAGDRQARARRSTTAQLGDEQAQADAREERRLFYVAMTRARERLVLSGAAKLDQWPVDGGGPIGWIGPAVLGEVAGADRAGRRGHRRRGAVSSSCARRGLWSIPCRVERLEDRPVQRSAGAAAPEPPPPADPVPPVAALSYSSLGEYKRCAYRFYAERVLGLPPVGDRERRASEPAAVPGLAPTDRGSAGARAARAARLPPAGAADERADRGGPGTGGAARTGPRRRRPGDRGAGRALRVDRAVRAAGPRDPRGPGGAVRVSARGGARGADRRCDGRVRPRARRARAGRRLQVRPAGGRRPRRAWRTSAYGTQRLVYALAALRAGATEVDVAHLFLERPDEPVTVSYEAARQAELDAELAGLAGGVLARAFPVTDEPQRSICHGCPAEGGLCSWPLEMTRRDASDRLF